jgi:hypothetical protein
VFIGTECLCLSVFWLDGWSAYGAAFFHTNAVARKQQAHFPVVGPNHTLVGTHRLGIVCCMLVCMHVAVVSLIYFQSVVSFLFLFSGTSHSRIQGTSLLKCTSTQLVWIWLLFIKFISSWMDAMDLIIYYTVDSRR